MPRFFDDRRSDFEEPRGVRGVLRPPKLRKTPQFSNRDTNRIATARRDSQPSVTTALGWKRVNGPLAAVQKAATPRPRSPAISQRTLGLGPQEDSVRKKRRRFESAAKAVAADRRVFNPTGFPKTIYGTFARTAAAPRGRLRFLVPQAVVPCVQRTTRRQVMFALRKAGGASSRKRKRYTSTSHIGC